MAFNKKRWQASNFFIKIGSADTFRRLGDTPLLGRLGRVKIGSNTRDAAGDQVITGVGFEPSLLIFMAVDTTGANMNYSIGFDQTSARFCITCMTNHTEMMLINAESIFIHRDMGNNLYGHLSAIGPDGFTIAWSLAGACATDFIYLCLP